ncbi:hypothetical protein N9C22_02615 [Paracoccaceae bacterium]|nr:hypothetical protein [Paracoccaceae bacterium]
MSSKNLFLTDFDEFWEKSVKHFYESNFDSETYNFKDTEVRLEYDGEDWQCKVYFDDEYIAWNDPKLKDTLEAGPFYAKSFIDWCSAQ